MDNSFPFAHVDLPVSIRDHRQVHKRLGVVATATTWTAHRPGFVQRCRELNRPGEEMLFGAGGRKPQGLERFVAFPVFACFEQRDPTVPQHLVVHDSSIGTLRYGVGVPQTSAAVDGAQRRLLVAVTGGSGVVYVKDLLETLQPTEVEVHLIVTAGAKQVFPTELPGTVHDLQDLADTLHSDGDLGAPVASGSFRTIGMVIVPCSAGTLAKVAAGMTDNLTSRAAHVALKERRQLLLVVRETPYSRPMIENMLSAFDAGATIVPASPGFYHRPTSVADLVGTVTARILDHFGIDHRRSPRWKDDAD